MPSAALSSLERFSGRNLRSAAFLCSVVMAALIYLLLIVPGANQAECPSNCHDVIETAHLPRGTDDANVVQHVLTAHSALATVDAVPPGVGGPALVALVTALVAAILVFFSTTAAKMFRVIVEAVLGVGRWHRTVILHL